MNNLDDYTIAAQKLQEKYLPAKPHISPFLRAFLTSVHREQKANEYYQEQIAKHLSKLLNTKVTVRPVKTIIDP